MMPAPRKSPIVPGRRRTDDAWRGKVRRWVTDLIVEPTRGRPDMRHADVRRLAIEEARLALDAGRDRDDLLAQFGGLTYARVGWVLRKILERVGLDWRSPLIAENVMGLVQRTLDLFLKSARPGRAPAEFDPSDSRRIALAGRTLATTAWGLGGLKPIAQRAPDRDRAMALVRAALVLAPAEGHDVPGDGPASTGSLASLLRLLLEPYDYRDPAVAAAILALIGPAIDAELARPEPGRSNDGAIP